MWQQQAREVEHRVPARRCVQVVQVLPLLAGEVEQVLRPADGVPVVAEQVVRGAEERDGARLAVDQAAGEEQGGGDAGGVLVAGAVVA